MPKNKAKESEFDLTSIVLIGLYLIFVVWWQYEFVYPSIKEGEYNDAFNIFIGWNPITPAWLYILIWLIAQVFGLVMKVWVFLFGE